MAGLSNKDIAGVFRDIELLMKVLGEDDRRAATYGRVSRLIETLDQSAADLAAAGRLTELKGVGPKVAAAVAEMVDQGTCSLRDELADRLAPGVLDLLKVPGLGPKKVHAVVSELGVTSIEGLEVAAGDGRLAALKGFGAKSVGKVLEGIAFVNRTRGRMRTADAWEMALELADSFGLDDAQVSGPARRGEVVVDTVSLVAVGSPRDLEGRFGDMAVELIDGIWCVARGARPALRVRLVPARGLARALFEETGPADHVAAVLARPGRDDDEVAIYDSRDLHWVPPERRHACDGTEPVVRLVEEGDLRGLVHAHTTWSDGRMGLAELVAETTARGWSYVTVTDHSRAAAYANGLSLERLAKQAEAIREFNARGGPVRVLHGIEVDILPDGSLDYPDEVLADLDVVIASVHSSFGQDPGTMTERVIRAVRHPHVDILGHATGRLLLRRGPYAVDVDRVLEAAAEARTHVELNANRWRLDLDPQHHARAVALGLRVPICPDAHSPADLDEVRWGVLAARHGGLRRRDVPNTGDADAFLGSRKR